MSYVTADNDRPERLKLRGDLFRLVTEATDLSEEEILSELIGAVCAHICTTDLATTFQEAGKLDTLIGDFEKALTRALAFSSGVRLWVSDGIMLWKPQDEIDA